MTAPSPCATRKDLAALEDVRPDDAEGLYHRPHGKKKAEAFLASLGLEVAQAETEPVVHGPAPLPPILSIAPTLAVAIGPTGWKLLAGAAPGKPATPPPAHPSGRELAARLRAVRVRGRQPREVERDLDSIADQVQQL